MMFILILIIIVLFCVSFISLGLFLRILNKYKILKGDVSKIEIALKRVRYGDINLRVSELKRKALEVSLNRLLETMYDREMMIKEYQYALSKKNLSLEEIIEQEKQIRILKEEFIATLTHDMKVPVVAELNSLNFLLENRFGELNDNQREILNLMKASNQELKELIENMLEVYKTEQQDINLNLSKYNLNDFINSVIKEMNPIALKSGHNILADLEKTNDLFIEFDSFQMKRVLKNMIQNALTYACNSSDVNIYTDENIDNMVEIRIKNQGISLSKEDLELVFNKYYQGHSKFKKAGVGLGLYISQKIISAHKGKIEVRQQSAEDVNDYGESTEFIISIPKKN